MGRGVATPSLSRQELAVALGPLVTPSARAALRSYVTGEATGVWLRYDHVKNWPGMERLLANPAVALADGEERMELWLEVES